MRRSSRWRTEAGTGVAPGWASRKEVGAIIYRENFLLAVGGILGLPFGLALCKLLVYAYDTECTAFHIEVSTLVDGGDDGSVRER